MRDHERYKNRTLQDMNAEQNKRDAEKFFNELKNGLHRNDTTIIEYCILLRKLDMFAKKPFRDVTKDDMIAFIEVLRSGKLREYAKSPNGIVIKPKVHKPLKESSLICYQLRLKRFYQWLYEMKGKRYPKTVNWMNPRLANNHTKLPDDIFTMDEIKRIVKVVNDTKEKALVMVLYESGMRVGELLNMRLRHIEFDKYGAAVRISGKTGERRLRLVESAPDLQNWCNHHPDKDNPDAYVWIVITKFCPTLHGNLMGKDTVNLLLKRLAKRAGIRKRVHPHLFRHTRFTHLSKEFTESEMKIMAGWSGASNMPQIYIHLSGADVEQKILEKHGLVVVEEKDEPLRPIKCPRCLIVNPVGFKFCGKCSMALDRKAVVEVEERRGEADKKMDKLLEAVINRLGEDWIKEQIKTTEIS